MQLSEHLPVPPDSIGLPGRVLGYLKRVSDLVQRHALWLVTLFTLFYLAAMLSFTLRLPLWMDEIATYYIARLPTVGGMISALKNGADYQPPLFMFLMHPFTLIKPELMRLPSVIGVGCMSVCLFLFTARRLSRIHGLVAMCCPFLTEARHYAYEARPYGMLLGASAAALVCWQSANDGHRRRVSLVGLWLLLTFLISIHYFGVILLAPFAAGELMKWWRTRRWDVPVIGILALSLAPLLPALPLIRAVRSLGMRFWGHVQFPGVLFDTYEYLMGPAMVPAVGLLIIVMLMILFERRPHARVPEGRTPSEEADLAAVATFLALPIIAGIAGAIAGGFSPRYAIAGTIGLCAALPYVFRRSREFALLCLAVVAVNAGGYLALRLIKPPTGPKVVPSAITHSGDQTLPIVFAGPHEYLETHFYAPKPLGDRLYYLTSSEIALRRANTNSLEIFFLALRTICDCNIVNYSDFLLEHKRFLVISRKWDAFPWLLEQLQADHALLTLHESSTPGEFIFDVNLDRNGRSAQ